jgi:hypothetical protein
LRCSVCENVIGFYEPVVVLDHSGPRHTSLHNEPMLGAGPAVMHDRCRHTADTAPPER